MLYNTIGPGPGAISLTPMPPFAFQACGGLLALSDAGMGRPLADLIAIRRQADPELSRLAELARRSAQAG